jgi:hypothetical protein
MKILSHNDGTFTARLRNGYEGSASNIPAKAKQNAIHEFNKDLKMVNQRASDFGVKIRYIDAEVETWTPGS